LQTVTDTLLELRGLTKAYPGVVANSDVSFTIGKGEVHALLGENGAGKSTLVKTIYGLVRPDTGSMTLNGAPYEPSEPRAARAAGVAMVFQHFSLFDALNVAENIALGMENPRWAISPPASERFPNNTACRLIPTAWSEIFRRANASGSRSSVAFCKIPNS
jgi:ABC-type uncharacterized transport system ATPase subunit